MIKVGIVAAAEPQAGELIRLLINHTDVVISSLSAPAYAGRPVQSVHHGLIGECELHFSQALDISCLDAVIIAADGPGADDPFVKADGSQPCVIDMRHLANRHLPEGFEYGLSEINRKPLVRGATKAVLPSAPAAIALVSLYPLAANLLLNNELKISIKAPADIVSSDALDAASEEIALRLSAIQQSFNAAIRLEAETLHNPRALVFSATMPASISVAEAARLYENIYDDHNFTYLVPQPAAPKEVCGTQKCLISLSKPDADTLRVDAVADCRMRGGGGEAVHVLNLLFALHELTGLRLKASQY